MSKLERFAVNGQSVVIEVEEIPPAEGFGPVGVGDGREDRELRSALDRVKPAAEHVVSMLNGLARRPDEYEVEFGLKFSAGVGALIAKTSTEANFRVKLKWASKKSE